MDTLSQSFVGVQAETDGQPVYSIQIVITRNLRLPSSKLDNISLVAMPLHRGKVRLISQVLSTFLFMCIAKISVY